MTNDPRNPLPGQPGGTPENPEQGFEMGSEQSSGSGRNLRGSTPTSGASAAGKSTPASERTYQQSQTTRTPTSQTYQQPAAQPTRTYDAPPRPNNNKKFALFGILGLLAVGGIIAGLAASNSSTPTVPAAIRPIPHHAARHVPVSTTHRVASINGTGVTASRPFRVTGPVTANYSYKCKSGSHPFTAGLGRSRTNVLPFVSTHGTGGSNTVSVPGARVGSTYTLGADSTCPYHVSVFER
jgi:hypothetical protein